MAAEYRVARRKKDGKPGWGVRVRDGWRERWHGFFGNPDLGWWPVDKSDDALWFANLCQRSADKETGK